jgi:NADH:ubiquinone oxidoreductase subunit E
MTDQNHTCSCNSQPAVDEDGSFGRIDEEWTELEPEIRDLIETYVAEHPGGNERLIPLLHHVQEEIGYLPFPVQQNVARALGLSPEQVYGVVTFYHLFTTTPRGKYQLKVCTGTACFVRRSQRLLESMQDALHIEVGGVTDDLLFSLDEVRCLGACGLAPAVMVNSEVRGNMAPFQARKMLGQLREQTGEKEDNETPENARG